MKPPYNGKYLFTIVSILKTNRIKILTVVILYVTTQYIFNHPFIIFIMKFLVSSLLFCFLFTATSALAQNVSTKEGNSYRASVNVGSGSFSTAFAWSHTYPIGKNKRFKLGYGVRLSNFFGSDLNYRTAPAKYTSGKESFAALFAEDINANIDTIRFNTAQTNSLNAGIYLNYLLPTFKNKLELGVNIDAIGFSFGGKQNATYNGQTVAAKPTAFNALLISDSDLGSLNSEWYIGYLVSKKVTVQLGYTFIFSEYTTDTKIQQIPNSSDKNDRFRHKASQLMLGIKFSPFKK